MGHSNVACSISSLSISGGDPVAFIPLLPKSYQLNPSGEHVLEPASYLIHPDCLYNPFCLPIKGTYDSYGGVEDIVHDSNTEAVERFFGIDIEDFVACVTCSREISSQLSLIYQHFANHYVGEFSFSPEFLTKIGFRQKGEQFWFEDLPFAVEIREPKQDTYDWHSFVVKNEHGEQVWEFEGQQCQKQLFKAFETLTDRLIYYNKKDETKIKLLKRMAGMFVHGEIFDELSKKPDVKILRAYDQFQKKLLEYKEDMGMEEETEGDEEILDFAKMDAEIDLLLKSGDLEGTEEKLRALMKRKMAVIKGPWRETGGLLAYFQDWDYFVPLYKKRIAEGKLRDELGAFMAFYWNMYSANRFYFPCVNGEQDGNPQVSKLLLEKSLEIVNRELKKLEEEE